MWYDCLCRKPETNQFSLSKQVFLECIVNMPQSIDELWQFYNSFPNTKHCPAIQTELWDDYLQNIHPLKSKFRFYDTQQGQDQG